MRFIFKACVRTFILIAAFAGISGCKHYHSKIGLGRPASSAMTIEYGSPTFRQGYQDGCASGYSGYGNNFNKFFFTWKQDPALLNDPVYYQIWKDAYSYCAFMAMINDEHGLGNWR